MTVFCGGCEELCQGLGTGERMSVAAARRGGGGPWVAAAVTGLLLFSSSILLSLLFSLLSRPNTIHLYSS